MLDLAHVISVANRVLLDLVGGAALGLLSFHAPTMATTSLARDLGSLFQGASVGAATAEPGEDSLAVLRRASNEMRSRKRRRKTDRDVLARERGLLGLESDPALD